MTSFQRQTTEELLAEFRKRQARARELQGKVAEVSGSATAPRRSVKVTVGAGGEVSGIEFLTDAYKRMPPAELSEVLLSTINEARTAAHTAVAELMGIDATTRNRFAALLGDGPGALSITDEGDLPEIAKMILAAARGQSEE
jgi:DNA-binding protein YbaB